MALTVSSKQFCLPSHPLFCTVASYLHVLFPQVFLFVCFFFNLMHTAFGKHQKASHLALFELRFHTTHVAKMQRQVVTTSQKVPCMSPLITKISDYASAVLIIRLHKISDLPESVRWEHITQIKANNFILNILFWKFLRQTNKQMLI